MTRRAVRSTWMTFIGLVCVAPAAAGEAPMLDKLSATRQRPLFVPARRPPVEKPLQGTGARQQQPPDVVLNAVMIGPGLEAALLKRRSEAKPFRVTTGADVDGWSVTSITRTRVVLDNKTQSITLEFPARANVPVPLPLARQQRADIAR